MSRFASALILATCVLGSLAGHINLDSCGDSPRPEYIDVEGCSGGCTVSNKATAHVKLAVKFPHHVEALRPRVWAKYWGIEKELELDKGFEDLCSHQGCPTQANETKVYFLDVYIDRWPFIWSITPRITLKLNDHNKDEVMCASFEITID